MQRVSIRTTAFALGFVAVACAAIPSATSPASAQTGPGWITLLDSKTMGDWNKVGESNWRMEGGALVADKKTSKDAAHLVSKKSYKDFQLYVEFWSSDDANSGIFIRCSDPKKVNARTC